MQKPSRKQRRTAPGNEPAVREEDARRKKVPPAVKQARARRHLSDSDVLSAPSPEAQRIDAELAGLEAWMARPAVSGNGPFGLPGGVPGRTEVYKGPVACSCLQRRRYPRSRPGGVPMAKFRIENVVASTSLGHELDLKAIALALGGSEYEPEQFPGLIYRIQEPKTAILLFRSGKVVCTGAKSLENVKTAIDLVSKQIQAAGIPIKKDPEIEVQNIVATSDLGAQIDLNAVAITLGLGSVEYEPEQFPGLVYRIDEPKVVLLMFGSGKGVCTGARKPADVEKAAEKITAELKANGLLH